MWRLAAASATGTSHAKTGAPCQDRHTWTIEQGGLIVAVSDGAGSAELSQVGAEIAVTKAVEILTPYLADTCAPWEELVIEAAGKARAAVLAEAVSANRAPRDYACTLLIIVLGDHNGAAMQIGDGLIAYRDDEAWGWIFWPQKGEYANTTRFLIEDNAERYFESTTLREPFQELAVMTDGLENLALHFATQSVHEPFLEAVMKPLRSADGTGEISQVSVALKDFLMSDRISSRSDDDLTLVLATRVNR